MAYHFILLNAGRYLWHLRNILIWDKYLQYLFSPGITCLHSSGWRDRPGLHRLSEGRHLCSHKGQNQECVPNSVSSSRSSWWELRVWTQRHKGEERPAEQCVKSIWAGVLAGPDAASKQNQWVTRGRYADRRLGPNKWATSRQGKRITWHKAE